MNESKREHIKKRIWTFTGILVASFGVTFALLVASRLSDDAIAVLAGSVCGVSAAIPTSLIIVVITRRFEHNSAPGPRYQKEPYPPVVVVNPTGTQRLSMPQPELWQQPVPRQFTIVGDEYEH